jgi:hypothetical protein
MRRFLPAACLIAVPAAMIVPPEWRLGALPKGRRDERRSD